LLLPEEKSIAILLNMSLCVSIDFIGSQILPRINADKTELLFYLSL